MDRGMTFGICSTSVDRDASTEKRLFFYETRAAQQETSLSFVVKECKYLCERVNKLEERFEYELCQKGLTFSTSDVERELRDAADPLPRVTTWSSEDIPLESTEHIMVEKSLATDSLVSRRGGRSGIGKSAVGEPLGSMAIEVSKPVASQKDLHHKVCLLEGTLVKTLRTIDDLAKQIAVSQARISKVAAEQYVSEQACVFTDSEASAVTSAHKEMTQEDTIGTTEEPLPPYIKPASQVQAKVTRQSGDSQGRTSWRSKTCVSDGTRTGSTSERTCTSQSGARTVQIPAKPTKPPSAQMDYYVVQKSIWDLPLLVGLPGTGSWGSAFVALLIGMNSVMQVLLVFIINDVFTVRTVTPDMVTGMREWRIFFGHSIDFMNKFSHDSYVKDVCSLRNGLAFSSEAVDLLNAITEYRPPFDHYEEQDLLMGPFMPHFESIGMMLSSLCVLIWIMKCIAAMEHIRWKAEAFFFIPRGELTEVVYGPSSGRLVCVSLSRKFLCMAVCVLETAVLLLLGFSGALFIIRTIDLHDLLLNCSALEVVLHLDDLGYEAFVPCRTKRLLSTLKGLPRPRTKSFRGLSWFAALSLIFACCCFGATCVALWHQEARLLDLKTEICGGNLDFIVKLDSAGMLTAGRDPPWGDVEQAREGTYMYDAMRQLILSEDATIVDGRLARRDMSASSVGVLGGPWSLQQWTTAPLETTMEYWNTKCVDMLPLSNDAYDFAIHFVRRLEESLGGQPIPNCMDVERLCNGDDALGVLVKQICPVSCGCDRPGITLVTDKGCSPTCRKLNTYNDSMWSRRCEDLGTDSPRWASYEKGLIVYLQPYTLLGGFNATEEAAFVKANGCGIIRREHGVYIAGGLWKDPCEISPTDMRPLTYACPVSCNCREKHRFLCPNTCTIESTIGQWDQQGSHHWIH